MPPRDGAQVRFLFVGRLEARKGIDVLLQVVSNLLARHQSLHVDIVGDDSIITDTGSTVRSDFERNAKGNAYGDRLRFHGKISEDKLRLMYAQCDIFVAPSRYESFGLIAIEAMMFSKPVVSSNIGGLPEIIVDGDTGLLARPGDPISLERVVERLILDRRQRELFGANGRRRYVKAFHQRGHGAADRAVLRRTAQRSSTQHRP